MTIRDFLSDRLGRLLLHMVSMAALAAFLLWTGTAGGVVAIILITWALGLAVALSAAFVKERARTGELQSIMDGLDQRHLFAECVEKPKSPYERQLYTLMRQSGRAMIETVSEARAAQREYREYIESWVHEIKAPITAAQLICRSLDAEARRRLSPELAGIDSHVERTLFYARSESAEKDFLIRQTALSDIVSQSVEKHRALLIHSGLRIEVRDVEHDVFTDEKWACFMLGQLLQNAARYKGENPVITLSARQLGRQVRLIIRDNGIGIPAHELPRIFDRGFTGSNGRARGGLHRHGPLYLPQAGRRFIH